MKIDINKLLKTASEATKHAHSPYSNYQVGAAILCKDGSIFTGCNIENASYGLTTCAERVAIQNAITQGKKEFLAIAIVSSGPQKPFPCGACRQVLQEFCTTELPVYISLTDQTKANTQQTTLGELLPYAFEL